MIKHRTVVIEITKRVHDFKFLNNKCNLTLEIYTSIHRVNLKVEYYNLSLFFMISCNLRN